ncbi:MAG: bestrophin family protein [Planctomycetota bacterium]
MTAYDPHRWTSHLFDIEGSMVREILGRVALCVAWSAVVVVLHDVFPERFRGIAIPETAHSLIGSALALLLVFRTNGSYDRFWEGRKQWGGIVNECRNLARQCESWLGKERELANRSIRWIVAFPFATMHRLRGDHLIGPVGRALPVDEVQQAQETRHVPLAVARKLTSLLHEAQQQGVIDAIQLQSLDQNIQQLMDYCGACERIRSTPAPYGYVVHLRRALIIYCLTLPLALVQKFGWESIIVTLVISYVLFGIEEIGVEIENPFELSINDLPLETICETIERDLKGLLKE